MVGNLRLFTCRDYFGFDVFIIRSVSFVLGLNSWTVNKKGRQSMSMSVTTERLRLIIGVSYPYTCSLSSVESKVSIILGRFLRSVPRVKGSWIICGPLKGLV